MTWKTIRSVHLTFLVPVAVTAVLLPCQPSLAADSPVAQRIQTTDARMQRAEARIAALQKRIAALEAQLNGVASRSAQTAQTVQTAQLQATQAQPSPAAQTTNRPAPPRAMEQASASSQDPHTPETGQPAAPRAAGAFVVDEDAAQRALERTLTQSGALLLPTGTIELTPAFSYTRVEQTSPVLVSLTTQTGETVPVLSSDHLRRNEFVGRLDLRAGLPRNSQVEISLPYNRATATNRNDFGGETSASGNGAGDFTAGVAKTLWREKGWQPDLIGRLSYNFGNGRRNDGTFPLMGGYRQLAGEFVALKRQDPLAFIGSLFYAKAFEKDGRKPGDAFALSLGTVLAASPATSLQLGFSQVHRQEQEVGGSKLPGSDQSYGVINLGASSVLSRDTTLIMQFGIGVGGDAPKYSVGVSLPILFR